MDAIERSRQDGAAVKDEPVLAVTGESGGMVELAVPDSSPGGHAPPPG
jgi:hypothetical protein